MEYQKILDQIEEELNYYDVYGEVASYIPELAKVDPKKFGMHLYCTNSEHASFGDSIEKFSIQSISKSFHPYNGDADPGRGSLGTCGC